jgi:hypothetical protein
MHRQEMMPAAVLCGAHHVDLATVLAQVLKPACNLLSKCTAITQLHGNPHLKAHMPTWRSEAAAAAAAPSPRHHELSPLRHTTLLGAVRAWIRRERAATNPAAVVLRARFQFHCALLLLPAMPAMAQGGPGCRRRRHHCAVQQLHQIAVVELEAQPYLIQNVGC